MKSGEGGAGVEKIDRLSRRARDVWEHSFCPPQPEHGETFEEI